MIGKIFIPGRDVEERSGIDYWIGRNEFNKGSGERIFPAVGKSERGRE